MRFLGVQSVIFLCLSGDVFGGRFSDFFGRVLSPSPKPLKQQNDFGGLTRCQRLEKERLSDSLRLPDHEPASPETCPRIDTQFAALFGGARSSPKSVNVYFVRHAESTWNEFTKGQILEVKANRTPRLTDAHLSEEGIKSMIELNEKIFSADCSQNAEFCFLAGKPDPASPASQPQRRVIYATSNLRRAIFTTLILFKDRLAKAGETIEGPKPIKKIHVLSSLQEMVTNIDSEPITPVGEIPYLTFSSTDENTCPFRLSQMKSVLSVGCNKENVNNKKNPKVPTLNEFCHWMAYMSVHGKSGEMSDDAVEGATDFVLVGHSIWIREFYQQFMDKSNWTAWRHIGRQKHDKEAQAIISEFQKLSNQGILKFKVNFVAAADGTSTCQIESESTEFVNGEAKKRFGPIR